MKVSFFKNLLCSIIIVLVSVGSANCQEIKVKSVRADAKNIQARTNQRSDSEGNPCALIRVQIAMVSDLVFDKAVEDVLYSNNEYTVYVPENTTSLSFKNKSLHGEINFQDYDIEIQGKSAYIVVLDTPKMSQFVTFDIIPANAVIELNGERLTRNEDGKYYKDCSFGEWNYSVSAEGYEKKSGVLHLFNADSAQVVSVKLEKTSKIITINSNALNTHIYIDGVDYGSEHVLKIPLGTHELVASAPGFDDYFSQISVGNSTQKLEIKMKESKSAASRALRNTVRSRWAVVVSGAYVKDEEDELTSLAHIGIEYNWNLLNCFGLRFSLLGGTYNIKEYLSSDDEDDDDESEYSYFGGEILACINWQIGSMNLSELSIGVGPFAHMSASSDVEELGNLGLKAEIRYSGNHLLLSGYYGKSVGDEFMEPFTISSEIMGISLGIRF